MFWDAAGANRYDTNIRQADESSPTRREWYANQGKNYVAGAVVAVSAIRDGKTSIPIGCEIRQ